MSRTDDEARFGTLLEALKPWLAHVVIAGGWAHRLYREHPLAQKVDYEPLITLDADVAMPEDPALTTARIRERLQESGFVEEFVGDTQPPVTHYQLGSGVTGFYVEFLTPLKGGEIKRDGSRDVTTEIGGVMAQKLRYLDLLLVAPWSLRLKSAFGGSAQSPVVVRVPNATSYIVQKLLIHDRRRPADRAKDILYIHDTVELFAGALPELEHIWTNVVASGLSRKGAKTIQSRVDQLFSDITDVAREAALMAEGRELSAAALVETCRAGLVRIIT